jgi:hypothetical protein
LTSSPAASLPSGWPGASPKLKMSPSAATIQYPAPHALAAMPTMGEASAMLPVDP